ncbi:MAG: extracellular solute-binding protein [Candidatus Tectomicrobia bacterium]|uniref:Extracellular solute-binding protein n=1 Tax=Tectimicrobiota bacterium TaxID=2528274 RepID=A0A937W231_UNCTE|nr:extracellular solute-binding protein [Candidatus Tectomicrobia bacterium]
MRKCRPMLQLVRCLILGVVVCYASLVMAQGLQPSCPNPKEVKGFLTCADVEKAEKEGAVVYYGPDVERQLVGMLKKFNELFPNISTNQYLREQTGRLYAKLNAERQAGTFLADVLALSDYSPAFDLIKKKGYATYVSPQMAAFDQQFMSEPPGIFTWYSLNVAGITYNADVVPAAEAPKSWKDLLDPKWRDAINFKDSASGLQGVQWFVLRQLYGDNFWKDMMAQKPRTLPSTVQQYERAVNREDKIIGLGQYNTYLEFKAKGAPLAFVPPTEGVVSTPAIIGMLDKAPHPEAAKLFIDWLLSPLGQAAHNQLSFTYSPRKDVAPPPGAVSLSAMKILQPDWKEYIASHSKYVREWNALAGMQ